MFSHGVVIQPSLGLELLFAVLTLQGILQLEELKTGQCGGHSPAAPSSKGCCCLSVSPVGSSCCSSTQAWQPAGSAASLSPSQSQTAALSFPSVILGAVIKPTCPSFCKTFPMDVDSEPHQLETSGPGVLIFLFKSQGREAALISSMSQTGLCCPTHWERCWWTMSFLMPELVETDTLLDMTTAEDFPTHCSAAWPPEWLRRCVKCTHRGRGGVCRVTKQIETCAGAATRTD